MVQNKLLIAKNYHIGPSEIDRLQYWEYEVYLEELNILEKRQQEENKKQQEDYSSIKNQFSSSTFSQQMKQFQNSNNMMPKMPSFGSGNFSLPKVSIPKF